MNKLYKCEICLAEGEFKTFSISENMTGSKDKFIYFECDNCGCLQMENLLFDNTKYYDNKYYAYENLLYKNNKILRFLKRIRSQLYFSFDVKYFPFFTSHPNFYKWLRKAKLNTKSNILDYGCGNGGLLRNFYYNGFSNLYSYDKFEVNNIFLKKFTQNLDIFKLNQNFIDLAIFNHSFEHIPNQHEILEKLGQIIKSKKYLLIRIPVKNEAWRIYNTNWVQIDAPRHFFLHTFKSICLLAKLHKFNLIDYFYDSTEFQFWGSILYNNQISIIEYLKDRSYFSKDELQQFKTMSDILNKEGKGDQVTLLFENIK